MIAYEELVAALEHQAAPGQPAEAATSYDEPRDPDLPSADEYDLATQVGQLQNPLLSREGEELADEFDLGDVIPDEKL